MTYKEAAKRRRAVIRKLGGRCAACGTRRNLELDHITRRHWQPEAMHTPAHVAVYEKAAKAGRLQVLCKEHHDLKTAAEKEGKTWSVLQFVKNNLPF